MARSADELREQHNQGEKDATEYNGYNRPHGAVESNLSSAAEDYQADNEAYGKGWENGRNQRSS